MRVFVDVLHQTPPYTFKEKTRESKTTFGRCLLSYIRIGVNLISSERDLADIDVHELDDLFQTQTSASLRRPCFHYARDPSCVLFSMDQPASSCMRSPHAGGALWGCVRSPHTGGSGAGLQPYQQAPFSLHQKHDFLAYTDFSSSCLVPAPHAYPREDRLYPDTHGGYQRAEWQFPPCEPRGRGQEPCQGAAEAVAAGVGAEMDNAGGDRLPGACLEGEYSPQSAAAVDMEKKSNKRKREITGESFCGG